MDADIPKDLNTCSGSSKVPQAIISVITAESRGLRPNRQKVQPSTVDDLLYRVVFSDFDYW